MEFMDKKLEDIVVTLPFADGGTVFLRTNSKEIIVILFVYLMILVYVG